MAYVHIRDRRGTSATHMFEILKMSQPTLIFVTTLVLCGIASACPPGTLQGLGEADCYRLHGRPNVWFVAETECVMNGCGHLVSVWSAFINNLLTNVSADAFTGGYLWLGGQSIDGTNWTWSDGTPWRYTNWAQGNLRHRPLDLSLMCSS